MRELKTFTPTPERKERAMSENTDVVLRLSDITKTFPGVKALNHVNLELKKGKILDLIGENGAGKSTLMKILTGLTQKTPEASNWILKSRRSLRHPRVDSSGSASYIRSFPVCRS